METGLTGIAGSFGKTAACVNFAYFPVQTGLSAAGQMSVIYASAVGNTKALGAGQSFGILLTAAGTGTLTVDVHGYLV